MLHARASRGQGSLEYLLLIAGAVLVAIIVLLLAIALGPFGQQVFNTNLIEYEHVDLCTGNGAECSFFVNWAVGLSTPPAGMVLENHSNWRTLVINGIELSLQCGDHVCIKGVDITSNPFTGFVLSVHQSSGGIPSGCSAVGTGGYVSCNFCDVAASGGCLHVNSIPFCPGLDGTPCTNIYNFPGFPQAMMTFPPTTDPSGRSNQKIQLLLSRINSPAVTGLKYNFIVKRKDAANNLQDDSVDSAAQLAFYHSFREAISSYTCDIATGAPLEGCSFGPGCSISDCDPNLTGLSTFCAPPHAYADLICEGTPPTYFTIPGACLNDAHPSTVINLGGGSGNVFRFRMPGFATTDQFISVLTQGLQVNITDPAFFPGACDEIVGNSTPDCSSICSTVFGPKMGAVTLYDLSATPPGAANECSALSAVTPSQVIPLDGPVTMDGGCYTNASGGPCQPYCSAIYYISSRMTQWSQARVNGVIGMRSPDPVPVQIFSPFSSSSTPHVDGIYYSST